MSVRWEELRHEAVMVWAQLDGLLIPGEANGDAAVLAPLLEAATAVLRVERMMTARQRWNRGRRPLTAAEVAEVLTRLDGAVALARRARVPVAAGLLVTARARVAHVGELVAAQPSSTGTD